MKRARVFIGNNNDTSSFNIGCKISVYKTDEVGHLTQQPIKYKYQININIPFKKKVLVIQINLGKRF